MNKKLEINTHLIEKASFQGQQQAQPMLESLENVLNIPLEEMLKMVVGYTGIRLFSLDQSENFFPNFSIISYSDCLQRNCLLFENSEGHKLFINDNPFDQQIYTWASYVING
ncbi:hypothetical protein [Acinetobacter pittii]|uniref:hypothetical protein n=1 Tax=Acinetobacter pittii TaxID=48296 RepID=UPI0024DE00F6|nr:hypothetical protein [Acinetobacter pittii]